MKKILVKAYSYLVNTKRMIKWNRQINILRRSISISRNEKLEPDGKYLLLLPHVDDEWIGASSIIKDMEYDVVLCNMNMPGGDDTETHRIRENELKIIGHTYGRKIIKYQGSIKDIIDREKPRYIMLPFFIDWHQEHIKVMKILFDYLQNENGYEYKIVMYQVSVPIGEKFVNRVNRQTKAEFKEKWRVFRRVYTSQIKIPYQRFGCNERISGALANSYAAEVFVDMNRKRWIQYYEKFILKGKDCSVLKQNINDLQKIRERVNEVS